MALLGIVLVALNLRTAVSTVSPIVTEITRDVPLNAVALGLLGAIPAVMFALSGLFGATIAKRLGLERFQALAIVLMVVGHLLRAFSGSFAALLLGSAIALIGAGVGNVLLPPLVKRYFPDRIGLVTTVYATVMSIGTAVPAAVAAPIANGAGWRVALGVWAVLSLTALVPWVAVLLQNRKERAALTTADEAPELTEPTPEMAGRIWHSRVAWTLALVFALSAFNAYAMFAWLPQLLVQTAGATAVQAGAFLALFGIMGLPTALVVPILAARMRNVSWLIQAGILAFVLGYLGLLLWPATLTWLWVALVGIGPLLFPAALTLINLRTRTQQGSVALSGFMQGTGYTLGALGPLLFGVLHTLTDGWVAPLLLLIVAALACTIAAAKLRKPIFVEDELRDRHSR
jgi:CP family cyanate transporter-like MFS transporter